MAMQPGEQVNPQFRRTVEMEQESDRRRLRGPRLGPSGRRVAAGVAVASVAGAVWLWWAGWLAVGVFLVVLLGLPTLVVALRG